MDGLILYNLVYILRITIAEHTEKLTNTIMTNLGPH